MRAVYVLCSCDVCVVVVGAAAAVDRKLLYEKHLLQGEGELWQSSGGCQQSRQ